MKPTIEIDMNDASFLAIIFDHWMDIAGIIPTEHMLELSKKLHGKVLC
jgi:hypothetical protein